MRRNKSFPFYTLKGTHKEIGEQFGQYCSGLIEKHLLFALNKLKKETGITDVSIIEKEALKYRPFVQEYANSFDEEIQGIAKGAKISLGIAYFLQLRAEMIQHFKNSDHECTTFALKSEVTKDGIPLAGQNSDLPSFYRECFVVVEIIPETGP